MTLRSKLQAYLSVAPIVVLSLLMLTGSAFAEGTLDQSSQEIDAKNLVPADGKSLVYFFYGRYCPWGNLELSLDGASSHLNKDMFVLWEIPAGKYQLEVVIPSRGLGKPRPVTADLTIKTDVGSVSYYRLINEDVDEYRLASMGTSSGRNYIDDCLLVSWFRDGVLVYQNEQFLARSE